MPFSQEIYADALSEGYTDTAIADFLAGKGMGITGDQLREARAEGYTDQQIVGFLVGKLSEAQPEPEEEEEGGFLERAHDFAGDLFAGIGSSFVGMPVAAVKGTGAVLGADVEGEFVSGLSEAEQDIQEWFGGDPSTVPYKFGSALGSMLAFVGATVAAAVAAPVLGIGAGVAGGASLLARAAPLAFRYAPATLMGAGAGGAEQMDRLRAQGDKLGDIDEIDRRLSILSGYAVGTSEVFSLRWPVGLLLKAIKKEAPKALVNRWVQTFIAAGAEGAQEAGAQVAQNAIAKGFYDPDLDITESAAENFGYGAGAAGVLHGVLALALPRTRFRSKEQREAEERAKAEADAAVVPPEDKTPGVIAARTVLGGADQVAAEAATEAAIEGVPPEGVDLIRNALTLARQDFVDLGGEGGEAHDRRQKAVRANFGEDAADAYAAEVSRLAGQVADARTAARTEAGIVPVAVAEEIVPAPAEPIQPTLPGFEDMRLEFASEDVIGADVNGTDVATRIISDFAEFLPIALDKGAVSLDDSGTPDVYRVGEDEQGRFFVETKNEVKASPYLSTREQAETVRGEMNFRVPEIFQRQDEAETEALAKEAVAQARGSERASLLSAAREINAPAARTTVLFGDLADAARVRINQKRISTGRMELTGESRVSLEELSDNGFSEESIADLLPDPVVKYTANDVIERVQAKGYRTDDEGFSRWARRGAGGTDLGRMTGAQLQQLASSADNLPMFPTVEGRLVSLPVVRVPKVTAQHYAAVINMAKAMPARPGKNLAEGEIRKSDINESLGVRKGLAEGVVQEALRRGDLVRSKYRAFIVRDKAREAGVAVAEEAAVEVDEFGQMELPLLKVRKSEVGPSPEARAAATAEFKARIDQATLSEDAKAMVPNLGGVGPATEMLTKRLNEVKGLESSGIALNIVRTIEGGTGQEEGVFNSAKMAIAIALDAIRSPKDSRENIMRDLEQVLDHETIHALRELGLFSGADWRTLTNFVKRAGTEKNLTYYDEAASLYGNRPEAEGLGTVGREALFVEEAIANAFSDYGRNRAVYFDGKLQRITGKPRNLLERIVNFFIKLRSGLGDMAFENANQVFTGLRAPRTPAAPAAPAAAAAAPGVTAEQQARAEASARATGQGRADAPPETLPKLFAVRRLSRGPRPRDPINTIQSPLNDDIVIADKALSKRARALSALDLTYNEELPPETGAGIGEVAERLQRRALRILKSPVDIVTDQSKDGLISDALAAEALRALGTTGNAADWYTAKVAEAMKVAGEIHPEILVESERGRDARFLFMVSLAITSQKQAVFQNSQAAEEVYGDYQRNGRFPDKGWGDAAPSMRGNFELLNDLIEDLGVSGVRELFAESSTVRELKQAGYPAGSAENMATVVYGSYLLGPKIGQGFYQNLTGNYAPLTIDMWLMRTLGRMSGNIIGNPALLAKQTDRLYESLLGSGKNEISRLVEIMEAESLNELAIIDLADDLRLEHERAFREAKRLKQKYVKPEWAKKAEAIVTRQTKPKDAPTSAGFRQASRRIANKVLDKVRASGYPDMTIADLQATLWYPEKSLWEKLGAAGGDRLNTDYAQAFRRIRDGIGDERILAGVRGAGRAAADVEGRDAALREELEETYGPPEAAAPDQLYAVRRKTASELLDFIRANPEGFTIDIDGTGVPAQGYAVAPVKEAETSIVADELTEEVINSFLIDLMSLQEIGGDTIYMGGWFNEADGKYYLDGVRIYDDLGTALYVAEAANQEAIFDLGEFNEIRTDRGIASLKEAGTYSGGRHQELQRTQANTARQFEASRRAREDDAGRGAEVQYAVRRDLSGEGRVAAGRRRLEAERAAAPSPEEALAIRGVLRSGDIRTGDYRDALSENALAPVFNAPTPMWWDGENHRVIISRGHNEWDDLKQGYNGFGIRHAELHLKDIQANSPFNTVEDFVEGMLSAYRTTPSVKYSPSNYFTLNLSGRHIILRWDNSDWPYPFTLVLQEQSFSRYRKLIDRYPGLIDQTFLSVTTAFALPAKRGEIKPKITQVFNPGSSLLAKQAAADAKPNERVPLSLKKQYSVRRRSQDKYQNEEQRSYYERHFDSGPENETFFEKIMRGMGLNSEESVGSRFRYWLVDRFEGWTAHEKLALKKGVIDNITAESSTSAGFSMLTRATGMLSAAFTEGFVIYNRGFFHVINLKVLESIDPRIAEEYRKEMDQLTIDTAYRDPITGEDVRLGGKWGSPQGLVQIFQEISDLGLMEQFFAYAGAVRAQRLKSEGREKLFSKRDIEIGLQIGEQNPAIRLAHQRYQLWNNALVNMMVKSGVISEQMGELWKSNSDYLPFYREFYADEGVDYQVMSPDGTATRKTLFQSIDTKNNKFFPSFQNIKQPKELKGGKPVYRLMVGDVADTRAYTERNSLALKARLKELEDLNKDTGHKVFITASTQRIRDPLSNILMNASAAISSSMTNVAVSRGIRDLRMMGDTMSRRISADDAPDETSGPQPNRIGIRVNGETHWYWVADRMLVDSLAVTNDIDMPFLGLQAMPARLLRELITKDPGFMVANMLRDTLSAWTTSGVNILPVVGTIRGYGEALMGTTSAAALRGAGVVGGYDFKGDMRSAFKAFKKHLKEGGRIRLRDAPSRIWRAWDKFAAASDTSTRIAVYNRVLKETGNEAQAILEALEVINFSRKGASGAMRYMTAVIPFLNARVQGLDVLHRGMKGEVTTWDRQARKTRFYWRAATIIALTAGVYFAHSQSDEEDDPWYHNAPEYIKDNYWIIPPTWVGMSKNAPAVRIPIPFEVGVLFKVIPERIIRLIDGSSDGRETWDALLRHGGTTLNFNPIPQWAMPVLEGVANYSFYRGEPIVGFWQGRNEGFLADPESASPFAIMLSKAVDRAGGRLSAQKVDHIFRGYVGTLGSYALMAADSVGRVAAGLPERPTRRPDQWPVLGRFLQRHEGRGPVQTFYELYDEMDIFVSTLNSLRKAGDVTGEDYYIKSRANMAMRKDYIITLKEQLAEMRKFRQQIKQDRSATPDQKRDALMELDRISNEIVSGVHRLRTEALTRM